MVAESKPEKRGVMKEPGTEGSHDPGYSIVGKSIPRVDAREKVTGGAVYTSDMILPGMLYGKILRSPLPHARITHYAGERPDNS